MRQHGSFNCFCLKVEELTAEEVLAKLQETWINEKNAPELLEPKMEVGCSGIKQSSKKPGILEFGIPAS